MANARLGRAPTAAPSFRCLPEPAQTAVAQFDVGGRGERLCVLKSGLRAKRRAAGRLHHCHKFDYVIREH